MSFNGDLYPSNASVVMTTKGDLVDFDTQRQRLAIGSATQVLTVSASGTVSQLGRFDLTCSIWFALPIPYLSR